MVDSGELKRLGEGMCVSNQKGFLAFREIRYALIMSYMSESRNQAIIAKQYRFVSFDIPSVGQVYVRMSGDN